MYRGEVIELLNCIGNTVITNGEKTRQESWKLIVSFREVIRDVFIHAIWMANHRWTDIKKRTHQVSLLCV